MPPMALFLRQFAALLHKNWIILTRHWALNLLRCFLIPVAYGVYLVIAQNFLIKSNDLGISDPVAVRTFAETFDPAYKFVWADVTTSQTSPSPVDIINRITSGFSDEQLSAVHRVETANDVPISCPQNFNQFSECFAAVVFYDIQSGFNITGFNYTIRGDAGLAYVNVQKHTSDVELRILPLQWALDEAIITLSGSSSGPFNLPQELPFTQMTNEEQTREIRLGYVRGIRELFVLALFVYFLGIVYHLPGSFMGERANLLTEHMTAMGALDKARILSWHIGISLAYIPAWVIVALIWKARIFTGTSAGIIIGLHLLTGLSLASWSFFVSVPYGKSPQLAAISTTFLSLLLAILALVLSPHASNGLQMVFTLIFPPSFFVFVVSAVVGFEVAETRTSFTQPDPDRGGRIGTLFLIAIIDVFLYPCLAVWWERSRYGAKNPKQARSWFPWRRARDDNQLAVSEGNAIEVRNLSKTFERPGFWPFKPAREVTAIEDLSLSIPRHGIFVLLGANGAGKSTVLSILGGLLGRDGGSVTFENNRSRERAAPGSIGIVPQKNVLWDEMTCLQTLCVWSAVKRRGTGNVETEDDLIQLLKDCGLESKVRELAGSLSGGQKRKLQLAIGMVGGSEILLVDEATSGVDPLSRRALWRALTAVKHDRTIIFTTHFLDEADLLGDRVAVLASPGKLLAEGSPVSLKSSLGEGYKIVVQFDQEQPEAEKLVSPATHEDLLATIRQHAPETTVTNFSLHSVTFALKTKDTAIVQQILAGLENEEKKGRIGGYEVNSTSLEDIFLDLMGKDRELHEDDDQGSSLDKEVDGNDSPTPVSSAGTTNPHPRPLDLTPARPTSLLYQSLTIFYKRLLILRRSWLSPLLAVIIACCGACIPLIFMNDRASTCTITFRPSRISPLWLPLSRVGSQAMLASAGPLPNDENGELNSDDDVIPRIAPPDVLNILGQVVAAIPTVKLADRPSFMQNIEQNVRNLSTGGIWVDTSSRQAVLAYEATNTLNGPTMLNLVTNVLFSSVGGANGRTIVANYMPFALRVAQGLAALKWLAFFGAAMAVFPAFFTLYVNKERRSSVQAMQLSNGVSNPAGMWLGHLLFDGIPGLIIATVTCAVFAATQPDQFRFLPLLWFVMVLYGYTSTLFAYCISRKSSSGLAAFSICAGYQVVMFLLYLTAYLLTLTYAKPSKTAGFLNIIHYTMSWLAPVNPLIRATFVSVNLFGLACDGEQFATSAGGMNRFGSSILYLILYGIILFLVLIWADNGAPLYLPSFLRRHREDTTTSTGTQIPNDVQAEARAVESDPSRADDPLRVVHVSKWYGSNQAVEDVSFGVGKDTIFAMLGPNGAGKTTAFNIIRGQLTPSNGDAFLNGVSITMRSSRARVSLGVCPQFTAIDSQLSVNEHLVVYGRLKGLRGEDLKKDVTALMKATELWRYRDMMASKLSGGNQRKLALAIAMIGNPSVLLIDEFSTGIAPDTKRKMWRTLRRIVPGKAVVITTHSMEEATALSTKVGIIARRLLAVGTTQSLAARYPFYEVHFSARTREELQKAQDMMKGVPGAKMADDVATRFEVPLTTTSPEEGTSEAKPLTLAELFALLSAQDTFKEFSVDRVGLESIFLKVIRENEVREEGESEGKRKAWWRLV